MASWTDDKGEYSGKDIDTINRLVDIANQNLCCEISSYSISNGLAIGPVNPEELISDLFIKLISIDDVDGTIARSKFLLADIITNRRLEDYSQWLDFKSALLIDSGESRNMLGQHWVMYLYSIPSSESEKYYLLSHCMPSDPWELIENPTDWVVLKEVNAKTATSIIGTFEISHGGDDFGKWLMQMIDKDSR